VAPGPLEGYLHCISSACAFGKHSRAIGHQAGALSLLLKKLCHGLKEISMVFLAKAKEETRSNHLNQCQGPLEKIKFSPLLHSCTSNKLG